MQDANRAGLHDPLPGILAGKRAKPAKVVQATPVNPPSLTTNITVPAPARSPLTVSNISAADVEVLAQVFMKTLKPLFESLTVLAKKVETEVTQTSTVSAVAEPVPAKAASVSSKVSTGDELMNLFGEVASGLPKPKAAPVVITPPIPTKVVAPVAPATAAPDKPEFKEPWKRVSEEFTQAVIQTRILDKNNQLKIRGTVKEGTFVSSPDAVIRIGRREGHFDFFPEAWLNPKSAKHEVISFDKKQSLGKAGKEFIPLAIFSATEGPKPKPPTPKPADKKEAPKAEAQAKATEPVETTVSSAPTAAPTTESSADTLATEAPTTAPATETVIDTSASVAPVNKTVSANAAVVLDRPIDPLTLVKGCLYSRKGAPVKKQVDRLRKEGFDLPYVTRCFSEEHQNGITYNVKPSDVVFLYDNWHLNSWIKADAKNANLKIGKLAAVTPVDFEMMSQNAADEGDRIREMLKSRGFSNEDKLAFDKVPVEKQETVDQFANRVAQEQWIPMINYLMASLKGEIFYSWRNAKNQEMLADIKAMDEVASPDQPEPTPPAPVLETEITIPEHTEPLIEEIPVVNEDLQAIFFGEESVDIGQPLTIAEEAILLSKAVDIDHAELAKAVNKNPASSEHAVNDGDK